MTKIRGGSRGGRGGACPHLAKKRSLQLIFFRAPARNLQRGTQQENVRKQRLVNARTSVPHIDSSIVSDVSALSILPSIMFTQNTAVKWSSTAVQWSSAAWMYCSCCLYTRKGHWIWKQWLTGLLQNIRDECCFRVLCLRLTQSPRPAMMTAVELFVPPLVNTKSTTMCKCTASKQYFLFLNSPWLILQSHKSVHVPLFMRTYYSSLIIVNNTENHSDFFVVILMVKFHLGKTRVHWKKKSKMAILWEKKCLVFKIFWGTAPDPQLVLSRATHGRLASRDLSYSCFPFGAPSSLKSWIRQWK